MNQIQQICFAALLMLIAQENTYFDPLPFSEQQVKNHIDLTIVNLKGSVGLVRIGIFTTDKGYPDQPAFNYSLAKDTLKNGRLRLMIPVDKTGDICISVLDDENENGKMDYKFGIMPKEGFGFSNNPKVTSRKPPPFTVTSFRFKGGERKTEVNMVYM
jgi:uncharacterized protein (DUF2141 family)